MFLSQAAAICQYIQVMNGLDATVFSISINYLWLVIGNVGLIAAGGIMAIVGTGED